MVGMLGEGIRLGESVQSEKAKSVNRLGRP